ncbi:PREDICTED: uncharacterized protein LOC104799718 [Tarenaya hassleriana]|uniref:uncharacterized protein LOC104799718 n=1 Tax=Tarenaya hassleriana TaxID=28532 RepID=UPI00053CA0E8|nr:PREDICTED: uncharacterized protein LOC104799718 [Tarenaya hassleriana]
MYELKMLHNTAYDILQLMCDKTSRLPKYGDWTTAVVIALFYAVSYGNREFVIEIVRHNPELIWFGPDGRNIFMMAVEFRKERIFELFFGLDDRKHDLINDLDNKKNRILHFAGGISPPEELSRVAGAALKMQREIQWFKEIESLVREKNRWRLNEEKLTGRQVFERDHKELRAEAEKWMKDTATACSLVAGLLATITFQAIFTSPGGTEGDDGVPFRIRDARFIVFVMADVLSFFSASTSLVVFLVILTSRFSSDDFHKSLPRKLILGLLTLFISIATMLAAFSAALLTIVSKAPSIVVPVMPLVGVPALLFMLMQYPLLKEMVSSTFGKGLFIVSHFHFPFCVFSD